eukprot:CAMPEP_0173409512 /NCGR_PEP_ID=MMETSP1356-20130122/72332_1 /TAXON_ID=77927 ORGANISM="Hemiselmis virescens, Strain PCC157" /NCGR_SAMPLE_ID=MMETSP1356 /ASSEMBLY_ACC=CAM_ASM_000847 /LENGTH=56 /DNA_ID=CAMNT_0014370989 /DNA_START=250 /DNA_END=420 /DNA_ORIENTATION=+
MVLRGVPEHKLQRLDTGRHTQSKLENVRLQSLPSWRLSVPTSGLCEDGLNSFALSV